MMRRDIQNWLKTSVAINLRTVSTTTPVEGEIIDTQGYAALEFLIISGVITTGTFTPSLQWGNQANLSDAVTVDADHIFGSITDATFAATDDNVTKKIGVYLTTYRYVRLTLTGSNTPNGAIGALALLSAPYLMPTA